MTSENDSIPIANESKPNIPKLPSPQCTTSSKNSAKANPSPTQTKPSTKKALITTLKQIHDELDAVVFDAYGWSPDLTDDQILENLVTLNAQRAEEERNGLIRWLRPDYQAPQETQTQQTIAGIATPDEPIPVIPTEQLPFPKPFKDQLSAIRDLLRTHGGEWTATQVLAQFKNATRQKRAILDCLESLEELGILASHQDDNQIRHWYLAELQQAS